MTDLATWMQDKRVEQCARVMYAAVREWNAVSGKPVGNAWDNLNLKEQLHLKKVVARCFCDMKVYSGKQLHEQCLSEAIENGWKFAEVEDRPNKGHPDIVSWSKLPFEARMKEHLLSTIIMAFLEGS